MRRKNDILWKGVMEVIFDDLLRFIFPEAEKIVDMDHGFDFLDKELSEMYPQPDKTSETKYVDKLVKVHLLAGRAEWVLVHLEVQGYPDKLFAERMFRYYCRIFDKYQTPITALAIFTGQDGKDMPDCYTYDFLGTSLMYKYNTCCISNYADEILMASSNPFALVALAAKNALLSGKVPERALMNQNILIAKSLYRKGLFSKRKIAAVLTFLENYVIFEDPEINRNFKQELDQIKGKTNAMDIFEQVAEIRAKEASERTRTEERQAIVKRLLTDTEFSIEKIASLANVSTDFVNSVKNKL